MTRLTGGGNLRKIGSGNIGATNVLRTGKKGVALTTLIFDMGKGAIAVLVANAYNSDYAIISALGAVIGHVFPIWLKFSGGKGVATIIGSLLAIAWPIGLTTICIWLIIAASFRYSSLAGIIALALSPIIASFTTDDKTVFVISIMALVSIFRHIENIKRLIKGEENKIKFNRD